MHFNEFTRNIFILLTMLSSTYHFWECIICIKPNWPNSFWRLFIGFSFFIFAFCFSFFVIRFSLFVFPYSISLFVFHFWFFVFRFLFFVFWHSKSGRVSYFYIPTEAKYSIFIFKILFWHSNWGLISHFWHSKSYFDIRIEAEYHILTFKILFWHSNWCRISYFDIQNPILIPDLRPNIVLWHSKSYFYIHNRAEYRILTFEIKFWPSN